MQQLSAAGSVQQGAAGVRGCVSALLRSYLGKSLGRRWGAQTRVFRFPNWSATVTSQEQSCQRARTPRRTGVFSHSQSWDRVKITPAVLKISRACASSDCSQSVSGEQGPGTAITKLKKKISSDILSRWGSQDLRLNKHSPGYLFLPEREVPDGGQSRELIWLGLVSRVRGDKIDSAQRRCLLPPWEGEVLRRQVEHMCS